MFTCNITGQKFTVDETDPRERETGVAFGYNSRFRAICYVLSKALYGRVEILKDIPEDKSKTGIGMSDSSWASICQEKFNYTNTFYHQEPYLDIYKQEHVAKYSNLDFIISSDVFEHIDPNPGIQQAFDNLYTMLKPGGTLIFSVPYSHNEHVEHFPNLFDYTIKKEKDAYILYNVTQNGRHEKYSDLCFHGGPGSVLEMRVFSEKSIIKHMQRSGFSEIVFHEITEDMRQYGIFWENKESLIISAKTNI